MTTQGARSARHRGTRESVLNIIDQLMDLQPIFLDIQFSLAQGKRLVETAAGRSINRALLGLHAKYKRDLVDLNGELEAASQLQYHELQAQLAAESERLIEEKMTKAQQEQQCLFAYTTVTNRVESWAYISEFIKHSVKDKNEI
ncbi:hypothetical protein FRC02_007911 [Tulasnella sp. 418]|nr:hypothetical protein FRC02_007911 [Tulasnella sp. 418]